MGSKWFVYRAGGKEGPYSSKQLRALVAAGRLRPEDRLWKDGTRGWVVASKIKGLFAESEKAHPETMVACPHCERALAHDAGRAGSVMACPYCAGSFQMPALEHTAPEKETASSVPENPFELPASDLIGGNNETRERWLVLTGGRDPKLHHELRRVIWQDPSDNKLYLADLAFTDTGLLVVTYQNINEFGDMGAVLGVAGILSEPWKKHQAYEHYEEHSGAHRQLTLFKRFEQPVDNGGVYSMPTPPGVFLPADEIEGLTSVSDKVISFSFRGRSCSFATADAIGSVTIDDAIRWQAWAQANRRKLSGGPSDPGLIALLEWGQRPATDSPAWVADAITRVDDSRQEANLPNTPLASLDHLLDLIRKLRSRNDKKSAALADRLLSSRLKSIKRTIIPSIILMILGIPAIICLVFLILHVMRCANLLSVWVLRLM